MRRSARGGARDRSTICSQWRQCIHPHVTEVIELLPPEVIVRRDIREQLTYVACEGEPVRAPAGETVVPNGKLELGLVAAILVEKYLDGLPLHRQRDRYRRLGLDIAVSTLADQVKWCTDRNRAHVGRSLSCRAGRFGPFLATAPRLG